MDGQQGHWDEAFKDVDGASVIPDDWLDAYVPILEAARGSDILDLGCGSGNDTKYLLERGHRVIACDYSAAAIESMAHNFPAAGRRHFDLRGGLPFPDSSALVALADLSLHYFPWEVTRRIVADIARVLAPGGHLLARVNSLGDREYGAGEGEEVERHYWFSARGHKRFFDAEDLRALFAGWDIEALEERTMLRYGRPKLLWELAARRRE
jgi:SAM-dependent methyltransferase